MITTNIKYAFKSIRANLKQYLCFFLAFFVIQTIFCVAAISKDTNLNTTRIRIEEGCDYHLRLSGLSNEQYTHLFNETRDLKKNTVVKAIRFSPDLRDAYVLLHDDIEVKAELFSDKYVADLSRYEGNLTVAYSALYSLEDGYLNPIVAKYWLLSALLLVFSVAIIMIIYGIRLNHYKFQYGIYMAFGAGFGKLFSVAIYEMLLIALFTFLPSGLFSLLVAKLVYGAGGIALRFAPLSMLTVLALDLITVLLSVLIPIKNLAVKTPVTVIASRDNSGYVSSPRRSLRLLDRSFPFFYELFSVWRFRKYYLTLLVSAVFFAGAFISGLYIADMNLLATETERPQFSIRYVDPYRTEDAEMVLTDPQLFFDEVEAVKGVDHIDFEVSTWATENLSHMLIHRNNVHMSGKYIVPCDGRVTDYAYACNNFAYVAVDELYLDNIIEHDLYEIVGDPYSVLNDPKTVIVSDTIMNTKRFDFKVGDTIMIGRCTKRGSVNYNVVDQKQLLRFMLFEPGWEFSYEEYTIGAVIVNSASAENMMIGMSFDDYESCVGSPPRRTDFDVYIDPTVLAADSGEMAESVIGIVGRVPGWKATEIATASLQRNLAAHYRAHFLIRVIAILILTLSPLVWFFSQSLFLSRRRTEMFILRSFGAQEKHISKIYLVLGGILSSAAFCMTFLMSYTLNFIVYKFWNEYFPSLGFGEGIKYEFSVSWWALLLCVVISIACGFLSTVLPYYGPLRTPRPAKAKLPKKKEV